jgi:hypothetical protein
VLVASARAKGIKGKDGGGYSESGRSVRGAGGRSACVPSRSAARRARWQEGEGRARDGAS